MADTAQALSRDFVLLAPTSLEIPETFDRVDVDPFRHRHLLHSAQRFRGRIYLSDGAVDEWQLEPDGRHVQAIDRESWHILSLDARGGVCGCVRYHPQANPRFNELGVRESALARSSQWGPLLRVAIEQELAAARSHRIAYAEVGGWAIAPERRCTPEALRMALSTYAIAQCLGGSRGITTATVRHHSSSILRRIGGHSLEVGGVELPPYYDAKYRCEMEILRFDSHAPGRTYRSWVEQLREQIPAVAVVCRQAGAVEREMAAVGCKPAAEVIRAAGAELAYRQVG